MWFVVGVLRFGLRPQGSWGRSSCWPNIRVYGCTRSSGTYQTCRSNGASHRQDLRVLANRSAWGRVGAIKNQHDLASTAGSQTDDFCRGGQSAFCRSQSSGPILIDSWLANSQRGREVLGGLGRKARAPSSQHHRNQRVLLLTASWHPLYGLPDGRKLLFLMVFGDGRGRWTPSLLMGSYYPRGLLQDGRDASLPSGANGGLTKPPVWMRLYECR